MEKIWNTEMLFEQIQKDNILDYKNLNAIANKIEMLDTNYTFELKQIILNKADIIKLNNLKEKYNDDETIKNELINELKEIALYYGLNSED